MLPVTNDSFSFGEMTPMIRKKRHNNQKVSCNECRRLKLRCSRVFPCSNCVKKGCGVICPDGSLITGRGNRFVLANEEQLYARIGILSDRARKLENALTDTHALLSKDPHPLLTDELLSIKEPLERNRPNLDSSKDDSDEDEEDEADEGEDVVPSSSILNKGRTTFFGRTASSWYHPQTAADDKDETPSDSLAPHVRILNLLSPFRESQTLAEIRGTVIGQLPEVGVALHLSQIYFKHAAWQYNPISEAEFEKTIIGQIYATSLSAMDNKLHPHYLAILFSILAIGTLLDLDRPAFSTEAAHYYQLGRAALSLKSVLEEQSITTIQALLLIFHYMLVANVESSRWVTMGLIAKLAHSIGLHRDSNKWKVSPEETIRRQALWWEVYSFDLWQSVTYGRPPSFMAVHVDCKMAYETTLDGDGVVEMSYAAWKHRFSLQCLSIIHDRAFGARTPSYKTIQELHRRVRDFYVPPSLRIPGFAGATVGVQTEQPTVQIIMQRCMTFAIKEFVIMYMHRGFFARAIEDNIDDPLGSPYGPSVLAVYGTSCSLVGMVESLFLQRPNLMERMWFLFLHVYSCALVLGAIASKPRLAFAPSALSHLECALRLFEKMSGNPRTEKILPTLRNLVARAHQITAHPTPGINSLRNQFSLSYANQPSMMSGMSSSSPTVLSTAPTSSGSDGISSSPPRQNATQSPPMANPSVPMEGWVPSSFHDSNQMPGPLEAYSSYAMTPTVSSSFYDADILAQFSMPMDIVPDDYSTFAVPDNLQSQVTMQNNRYELDTAWHRFVEQMGTM